MVARRTKFAGDAADFALAAKVLAESGGIDWETFKAKLEEVTKRVKQGNKSLFESAVDVYRALEDEGLVEPQDERLLELGKKFRIIKHRGKNRGKATVLCPLELVPQFRMAARLPKEPRDARLPPRHC